MENVNVSSPAFAAISAPLSSPHMAQAQVAAPRNGELQRQRPSDQTVKGCSAKPTLWHSKI